MTRRRRKRSRSRSSSRPRSRSPSRQKGRWSATTEAQRVAHVVLFQEKNVVLNLSSPPPLSWCRIALRVYGARARPFEAHDCQAMYDGDLSEHARSEETSRKISHHAAPQEFCDGRHASYLYGALYNANKNFWKAIVAEIIHLVRAGTSFDTYSINLFCDNGRHNSLCTAVLWALVFKRLGAEAHVLMHTQGCTCSACETPCRGSDDDVKFATKKIILFLHKEVQYRDDVDLFVWICEVVHWCDKLWAELL